MCLFDGNGLCGLCGGCSLRRIEGNRNLLRIGRLPHLLEGWECYWGYGCGFASVWTLDGAFL